MVPNLYLPAFVFTVTLALICLAELVGCVRDRTNLKSLAERPKSPLEYRFLPPLAGKSDKEANDELELLDIVLVASVDGKFHALNRTTGHSLWSMASSSGSESAPSTLAPLVRTTHVESDPDTTDDDAVNQELYIIEPQSGDIFVMASPASPLQRLPFSMSQLVDMSPFRFSGDEDGRVFVGRKETSLLLIELETGKVKATINSECPWDPFEDLKESTAENVDLDELESGNPSKEMSTPTEVFIGRTDYHISIHTRPRTSSSPKPPVQHLSFSTYGPNNQDSVLQSTYRRTPDDAYIQSGRDGEVLSFKTRGGDGSDPVSLKDSQLLWGRTFSNPIVVVFDVLQSPGRQQPFVLAQPSPRLHDIPPGSTSAKLNLPSMESAYVGLVEESGSLFAMSPSRFPLVVFGDVDRGRGRGWLIDSPPGMEPNNVDLDIPLGVDSVTKARKVRELCRNGSPHRKCLTGVRPLEASGRSRLSRLLDGAPSVPLPPESQLREEQAFNSGDVSTNSRTWNNRTIVLPWITVPGRNTPLSLDSSTNALSALMSFVVAVALCVGWFVARHTKRRGTVDINHVNEYIKDEATASSTPKLGGVSLTAPSTTTNGSSLPSTATPLAMTVPELPLSPSVISRVEDPSDLKHTPDSAPPEDIMDGEDSDRDGDDSPATPGKRRGRRGRRGKKKKPLVVNGEEGDGENFKDKPANGNGHPDSGYVEPEPKDGSPPTALVVSPTKRAVNAPSLVVSDTVLGFGSHGTVVFRGSLQGRSVAVKRLLQDFVTLASREVSILQESDDHPNVIRYYYQEAHANFLYIALELCPASLADIIESPDQFRDISIAFDPKRALRQIASGLRHLHALKLVHRDIKPQNILISSPNQSSGKVSGYRMLISDFGLCKKLDVDQTSFLPTAHGAMAAGTVGWRAPEILRGEVKLDESIGDDQSQSSRGSVGTPTGATSNGRPTRLTKSVDIFALGCLFYYTLTNGCHPFGDRFEREVNILKNEKYLGGLDRFGEEGSEAVDLITDMLNPEAYGRPDTTTCLLHPFFWDPGRRLTFLQDASDRFEIMCRDPRDQCLVTLETGASNVVGHDWHSRLDKLFIENLGKFRKYDGKSVQDLLRALRNKKHHYQDMPENVKRHLGPMPEGYLSYFTRRFPRLFIHVHSVIATTPLHQESMFRSYFELTD